jgi:hypothetical protein
VALATITSSTHANLLSRSSAPARGDLARRVHRLAEKAEIDFGRTGA